MAAGGFGSGAVELGVGYISVTPNARGFRKDLDRQITGVDKVGENVGKRVSSGMTRALKVGAAAAGAAAVAGIGMAFKGGLESALNVDTVTRSLAGLHGSAEAAADTMERVAKVSRDSSINHADYAAAAQNLAYIGVEGDQLERILTNAGDAIVGFGGDGSNLQRVNDSLSKMVNNGKVNREELLQLSDAGIPVFEGLATHLGVTVEEMNKMVSDGAVGIEDVLSVMENGTGQYFGQLLDASDNVEQSLGSTWKRVKDNVSLDIGQAITNSGVLDSLVPVMERLGDAIVGVVGWLVNDFIPALQTAGEWVRNNHTWIGPLAVAIGAAAAAWGAWTGAIKLWQGITKAAAAVQAAFNAVMAANPIMLTVIAIAALVAGLTYFFTQTELGQQIWQSFTDAISVGWEWVKNAFATAWAFIQPIFEGLWTAIQFVGAVFAAVILGSVMAGWNMFAAVLGAVWNGIIKPVWDAFAAVMTWLWNTVVMPIWDAMKLGLQFLGQAFQFVWETVIKPAWDALGAGIAFVWNTVIRPAWDALKAALGAVGSFFQMVWNTIIKPAWDALGNGIRWVIDNVIKPAWEGMKTALQSVGDFFRTVVDGIRSVWDKMKGYVAEPINFVIETVWNRGLVRAWNTIGGPDGFLPGLPEASTLEPIAFATGGAVSGPGTGTSDSILARLSAGEHVITAAEVEALGGHNMLYALRALIKRGTPFNWDQVQGLSQWPTSSLRGLTRSGKGDLGMPAFRDGGEVRPAWMDQLANGHRAAKMRHGNPYTWGFEDCSGYVSAIADAIINGGDGKWTWATGSFPGGQPWVPGLGPGFSVGVHDNPGGPGGGHTSGTLSAVDGYSTTNVESGGSHGYVAYGGPAVGADHSQWEGVSPGRYHLAIGADGAFESGGGGGGPSVSQQISLLRKKVEEILDKALDPIKEAMGAVVGDPPPHWLGIPPVVLDETKTAAVDTAFDLIENLGDKLRSAYDLAKDVTSFIGTKVTGLFRDQGGYLPTGQSVVTNETGKPEAVLNWEQLERIRDILSSLSSLEDFQYLADVVGRMATTGIYDPRATRFGITGEDDELVQALWATREQWFATAAEIEEIFSAAGQKALTGYRDEALDFFGFKGLFDDVSGVWDQIHSPATNATSAAATVPTTSGITGTVADVDTGLVYGDPNVKLETTTVELETNMPDLDTSAPGSGPVVDQVREAFAVHGWDSGPEWAAVDFIVSRESSWDPNAQNPSTSAYGLFQFLDTTWAETGIAKTDNPKLQAEAGAKYIKGRYGSPTKARAFWEANNWYDQGGWLQPGVTLTRNETGKPEAVLNPSQWSAITRQTDLVSDLAQNGGGPLVVIEKMEARNEAEAMRAASREARRLTRSTSLVGGWRS